MLTVVSSSFYYCCASAASFTQALLSSFAAARQPLSLPRLLQQPLLVAPTAQTPRSEASADATTEARSQAQPSQARSMRRTGPLVGAVRRQQEAAAAASSEALRLPWRSQRAGFASRATRIPPAPAPRQQQWQPPPPRRRSARAPPRLQVGEEQVPEETALRQREASPATHQTQAARRRLKTALTRLWAAVSDGHSRRPHKRIAGKRTTPQTHQRRRRLGADGWYRPIRRRHGCPHNVIPAHTKRDRLSRL